MQILLARPRGFCAGVTRAVSIVERALAIYGAPVYVHHEIVHNRTIVRALKEKGAVFVDSLASVPDGATLIFSAHGVPKSIEDAARARPLTIFDATCPLVTKVHREIIKMHEAGLPVVIIGHKGHPEVEGTVGQIPSGITVVESVDDVATLPAGLSSLACVTQTTISTDDAADVTAALKARFPNLVVPKKSDICYATQSRQDAVKKLARRVDLVLVIGSVSSSNSNRLKEVAARAGTRAYPIEDASYLNVDWLAGISSVGITAGASAPEFLVEKLLERIREVFPNSTVCELEGPPETYAFPMPKGLWKEDLEKEGGK